MIWWNRWVADGWLHCRLAGYFYNVLGDSLGGWVVLVGSCGWLFLWCLMELVACITVSYLAGYVWTTDRAAFRTKITASRTRISSIQARFKIPSYQHPEPGSQHPDQIQDPKIPASRIKMQASRPDSVRSQDPSIQIPRSQHPVRSQDPSIQNQDSSKMFWPYKGGHWWKV